MGVVEGGFRLVVGDDGRARLEPMVEEDLSDIERIEVAVWAHQEAWAKERFGEDVSLNVGSGTDVRDDGVSVTTKVYGHGRLTTTSAALGVFEDEWEPWS